MRRILLITTLAVVGALLCCTSCSQRKDDALPDGIVNQPYDARIVGVTGQPPLSWSVTGGALPDGLSLSTASGEITGTPKKAGELHFSVTVEDSASVSKQMTKDLSIRIRQPGGGGSSTQRGSTQPATPKGGQLWNGTMHSESTWDWHRDSYFITCTEVWDTKLSLTAAADGSVNGTAIGNFAEQRNCRTNFYKFPNQMTYFASDVKGQFDQKHFELQFFETESRGGGHLY